MKQEEKTRRTQERILTAALAAFGAKGYESASINAICSASQAPKGLIYHNFKSKDELYLQCVRQCYQQMTEYLMSQEQVRHDAQAGMKTLLTLRQKFFSDHPHYADLFFHSLLQPPKHLLSQIKEARRNYDEFCAGRYREILNCLSLRDGITERTALEYFSIFMEMYNGYFQSKAGQGGDYRALIEAHEEKLAEILDIALYGIAKQNEKTGNPS